MLVTMVITGKNSQQDGIFRGPHELGGKLSSYGGRARGESAGQGTDGTYGTHGTNVRAFRSDKCYLLRRVEGVRRLMALASARRCWRRTRVMRSRTPPSLIKPRSTRRI